MWAVAMAAMNPAAETQKTDRKLPFSPSTHPDKVRGFFFFSYDKSNLNMFLVLTQLREQGKKKEGKTNRRGIRIRGPQKHLNERNNYMHF